MDKFRLWAKANKYTVELLLGNTGVLDEYTNFLTDYPNEILSGLLTIIKAANTFGFSIDHILERLPEPSLTNKVDPVKIEKFLRFHYQKAIYAFNHHRFVEGLETILYCLSLSISTKNHPKTVLCTAWFQKYIKHVSNSQKETFSNIMEEVLKGEN
ncbi:hypothetical protein MH216_20690 [Paenibacillus larvae]|uniref:hypothetical protein n=1 Tax=Paenibacillus larvae TaxID=1464 RepID=UPI00228208A8|nr:hypothetical protein [Paenibacillus larvae]MCY7522191.1 hypothetical protein [Paenibacillus larvae]